MDVDMEEGCWDVEEIVGSSYDAEGKVKYLTRWVGFPEEENWTEEPLENFLGPGAKELVRAFHRKHPNAAKDPRIKLRG
jgi:hypothetical protein